MDRLEHDRAGPGQRASHDQPGQLAEVTRRAGHAGVEGAVRMALPGPVAGVGHREPPVDDLPAVVPVPEGLAGALLDRPEEGRGHRPELDLEGESGVRAVAGATLRPVECGLDAQAHGGQERVAVRADQLDRRTRPERPLDTDGGRGVEGHVDAELLGQRGLDDLLLHLAVQGQGGLAPDLATAQVDQRVLLAELGQRGVQPSPVAVLDRPDDGLQGRGREVMLGPGDARRRRADDVADPDVGQAPDPGDLPGPGDARLRRRPTVVHLEVGHLGRPVLDGHALAHPELAGEQPQVGDPLAGRAALDLEHEARQRAG